MMGDIDYIDDLARTDVIRHNEQRASKRRELDPIDLDNITHLETLIAEHPELSLMVEHDMIVSGAVTQLRFRLSFI